MENLIEELIKSNNSVKEYREKLLEDSKNFTPGSAADVIFNFYKYLRKYYSDLLVYQFQLYSDRPKYVLTLESIKVTLPEDLVKFYTFNRGRGTDLSVLRELNDTLLTEVSELTFSFVLSPELLHLVKQTENNVNKELFTKVRELSVGKGDGTYITGNFTPEWNDDGLTLTTGTFLVSVEPDYKSFSLGGGIY